MMRKLTFIFVLAILFGAFLVVNPYLSRPEEPPSLEDRLMDADFMATADCIRLAKEVSGMLYYYKVPYRDFLSPEFILSQAKAYGIYIQNPMYFFANKDGEFGILAELNDSTKLNQGVEKLKHFFDVKEMRVAKQKVYKIQDFDSYVFYGNDYICFYKGDSLKQHIRRITEAKTNQVSPTWIELINQQRYLNKSMVLYSRLDDFQQISIDQAIAYPVLDSTHVYFYAYLASKDTLPFKLKNEGSGFVQGEFTKSNISIHLDPTYLQQHPEHPLYTYLIRQSARIRFPFKEFMKYWNGDLSFQQGGWINIDEKFIESELDEDFNVTEVVKTRQVKVPGFALNYSLKEKSLNFLEVIKSKGFLTEQEGKYHLLLSPPLNFMENKDFSHTFYAAKAPPKMVESKNSYVTWTHRGTQYTVMVDSLKTFEFYGNLSFSMEHIFSRKNLTDNF